MKISVITSTLNCKDDLLRTITQLQPIMRDFDIEYIIIDGGSIDGTLDLIKDNIKYISYYISEPDNGIYDAWNKGLLLASGDYISFVGAGDFYIEKGFRKLISLAKINPDSDIILGKINIVSGNNILYSEGESWNWKKFKRYMHIDHPGALHSRRLFERYGNFDTTFKIAGDYEFLLRAGSSLKSNFVDDIILNMKSGGISHSNHKVFNEVLRAKIINKSTNKFFAYFEFFISLLIFKIKSLFFPR